MKKFDKVICIIDAPLIDKNIDLSRHHLPNLDRAYKVGDIYEVVSIWSDQLVIWYPPLNSTMSVNRDNFILLSEWRDRKIESVLNFSRQ